MGGIGDRSLGLSKTLIVRWDGTQWSKVPSPNVGEQTLLGGVGIVDPDEIWVAGWPLLNPPDPTFLDVEPNNAFYQYVETAHEYSIISGYADGTFRPGNNATRGQIAKIVYQAITQP